MDKEIIDAAKKLSDTFKMDYCSLGNPEVIYEKDVRKHPLSKGVIDDLIELYLKVLKSENLK